MNRYLTLDDVEVDGLSVLVRSDLNVPLEGGEVGDDFRIRAALPTLERLVSDGADVTVCSHLGRPKGVDPELSLQPVAARMDELSEYEVGFESGGDTGWPATDWMEDIMLRTAGTDTYDQWVSHEIPFNDPAVLTAAETFGEIMFGEGYVLGGADQTPSIAFGDAPGPMFEEEPGCFLHRQASFINAFFPSDAEAGVDYDWFPFPPIDEEGILFAGEFAVAFRDAPEVRDFLEQFAGQEVQCAMGGDAASSRLSPRTDVGPDCYANEILADSSEVVTTALEEDTGRFDASDQMPPQVGTGSFWTGMMTYMQGGPDSASDVLDEIESTWPE